MGPSSTVSAWVCLQVLTSPVSQDEPERLPNVVLILADDLGFGDLGCYGSPIATPHLDRLASQGVRFTDFYVSQPTCSASRASLLTGCYANRVGIHGALGPQSRIGLNPDETTIAEICRVRGYATAIFGKWHLGHEREFLPTRQGFDVFYGIPYSHDMWPMHAETPGRWGHLHLYENETIVARDPDPSRSTADLTTRSVGFIEKHGKSGKPFFLYVPHPMPHAPLAVSEAFEGHSGEGLYGDVIQEIDASVGAIVAALERCGVRENTLVFFTSDNGPWLSYGDHAGSAGPLREGKGTTFEGGARVPAIASFPGRIPQGAVCGQPWMTIDLLPTIAGLIGAELPSLPIDGQNAWTLFERPTEAQSPRDACLFWNHEGDLEAMRSGQWKLHFPHGFRSMEGRRQGRGDFPGEYDYGRRTGLALYDLEADVGERLDVSLKHPDVVERLQRLADLQRNELGDRLQGIVGTGVRAAGRLEDLHPGYADLVPASVADLQDELRRIASNPDQAERERQLAPLWNALVAAERVPFAEQGRVLFLWRGTATEVSIAGDMTGWRPDLKLDLLEPLNLWHRHETFEPSARLDYKFVIDGQWHLDPANPRRQKGGFGENSDLWMPEYVPSTWPIARKHVQRGAVSAEQKIDSKHLGATIRYTTWTPASAAGGDGRILYVLDGHEYSDPELGSLPVVAENLLAAGRIQPFVAVFIDPRVDGVNRRIDFYRENPRFTRFLTEELIPVVESDLELDIERERRGILGTSLGGLCGASLLLTASDHIGLFGLQSPALAVSKDILKQLSQSPRIDARCALSAGTYRDGSEETRRLAQILTEHGATVTLTLRHEAHSWGQWRGTLGAILELLFGD